MTFGPAIPASASHPSMLWLGWVLYACFVAYGSLVPLNFQPRPLGDAWLAFQHLPFLEIGVEGRADWISNGVLYVPLGFLTASLVSTGRHSVRALLLLGALIFCCAFAIVIEFLQVFFPPRTVSLNDVIAECLGSLLGIALAARWSGWFRNLVAALFRNPVHLAGYLLTAYAAAYLLLSLFPYDFLLSAAEIKAKLQTDNWAWFWIDNTLSGSVFIAMVKLAIEALAAVPFGFLLRSRNGQSGALRGFFIGAGLGVFIETAQLFIFSGISQGVSVLTRAVGVSAGVLLSRAHWDIAALAVAARRFALGWAGLYLLALSAVNGWFTRTWGSLDLAARKLADANFIPLYYHYYTSEAVALVSFISVLVMYAPIGVLTWLTYSGPMLSILVAASAAFVMEAGKLFLVGAKPDPTNILIAAFAGWAAERILTRLAGVSGFRREVPKRENTPPCDTVAQGRGLAKTLLTENAWVEAPVTRTTLRANHVGSWRAPSASICVGLVAVLTLLVWSVANFPFQPVLLGLLLAGYSALVWRHPPLLVAAIPAALPVLDLAPWSGRFYFDEFDLLIMASLAVGYARVRPAPRGVGRDALFAFIAALVALSYAISAARGLLPWQAPDDNAFTNYYSSYNALRIAKGALWAFLLYGVLSRLTAAGHDVRRLFAWGMVVGLGGTVAVIVWERITFPGLINFASDYRVTGPFSAIHTGGAYIETFLTAATPFLVLMVLQVRNFALRLGGVALLLGTTYAVMVTFSRNGYAAFGVALALVCLATMAGASQPRALTIRRAIAALVLVALSLAVALPIFKGPFAQARMSQVANDLAIRQAHWADAMRMRNPDWATILFGMGVGRYPETHYWHASGNTRSGSYRLEVEAGNRFLRLGSGHALYMDQFVGMEPQRNYVLSLDVRSNQSNAEISVPICEKWMLASFNCTGQSIKLGKDVGSWHRYEVSVASGEIGSSRGLARPPVKLTLFNPNKEGVVDVDNVRLTDTERRELLTNGDFSQGLDRWFFATDNHLLWHIKNMMFATLFEQGWFGVIALGLLAALALARATSAARVGNLSSGAVLASLVGFLVVGVFDSLIDTPRFLLLFLLLVWFASVPERATAWVWLKRPVS